MHAFEGAVNNAVLPGTNQTNNKVIGSKGNDMEVKTKETLGGECKLKMQ